jgi:hypothetical protein
MHTFKSKRDKSCGISFITSGSAPRVNPILTAINKTYEKFIVQRYLLTERLLLADSPKANEIPTAVDRK